MTARTLLSTMTLKEFVAWCRYGADKSEAQEEATAEPGIDPQTASAAEILAALRPQPKGR